MDPKNPLSSSLLNLQPYVPNETETGFEFTTDKGAVYDVYFGDGNEFFAGSPLAPIAQIFGFSRKKKAQRGVNPLDDRIKLTIKTILYQVLEADPSLIIVFNCSTEGSKQIGRSAIFNDWFDEVHSDYDKLNYSIVSPTGQNIPTSVILRADHPLKHQVTPAIQAYVLSKATDY